jgi:hypothetical protein
MLGSQNRIAIPLWHSSSQCTKPQDMQSHRIFKGSAKFFGHGNYPIKEEGMEMGMSTSRHHTNTRQGQFNLLQAEFH